VEGIVDPVPVHIPDSTTNVGPFVPRSALNLPSTYILTKTHCFGYCTDCSPAKYVFLKGAMDTFYQGCRTSYVTDRRGNKVLVPYTSWERVKKAIHLIRDPFDNIVARWHLDMKHLMHKTKGQPDGFDAVRKEWRSMANPRSPEGFRAWCRFVDQRDKARLAGFFSSQVWIDSHLRKQMKAVPCAADWFRYTQWHNLAIAMVKEKKISTHLLYYESYSTQYNQTVQDTLDFLQLPWIGPIHPFIPGKTYHDYYTPSEALAAMQLVKGLASAETWKLVGHYFEWVEDAP
jgi:hypothetical protein